MFDNLRRVVSAVSFLCLALYVPIQAEYVFYYSGPVVVQSGGKFTAFTVASINSDPLLDSVVIIGGAVQVRIASFETDRNVYPALGQTIQNVDITATILKPYDIDQDQDQDLVVGPMADGSVIWLENPQGAVNSEWNRHILVANAFPAEAANQDLLLTDLDGGGQADLYLCYALPRTQAEEFSVVQKIYTDVDGEGGATLVNLNRELSAADPQIALYDLDRDGKQDLLFSRRRLANTIPPVAHESVTCQRNASNSGSFRFENFTALPIDTNLRRAIDIDDDHDVDFLQSLDNTDTGFAVVENQSVPGSLRFEVRYFIDSDWSMGQKNASVAVDLDRDGDEDFVTDDAVSTVGLDYYTLLWRRNRHGEPDFGNPVSSALLLHSVYAGNDPTAELKSFVVDADGDGDFDIMTYNRSQQLIIYFTNNSPLMFAEYRPLPLGPLRPADPLTIHWAVNFRQVGSAVLFELWHGSQLIGEHGTGFSPTGGGLRTLSIPSVPPGEYHIVVRGNFDHNQSISLAPFQIASESGLQPSDWMLY